MLAVKRPVAPLAMVKSLVLIEILVAGTGLDLYRDSDGVSYTADLGGDGGVAYPHGAVCSATGINRHLTGIRASPRDFAVGMPEREDGSGQSTRGPIGHRAGWSPGRWKQG